MKSAILLPLLLLLVNINPDDSFAQNQAPNETPPSIVSSPSSNQAVAGTPDAKKQLSSEAVFEERYDEVSRKYWELRTCLDRLQDPDIKLDDIRELRECLDRDPERYIRAPKETPPMVQHPSSTIAPQSIVASPSSSQAVAGPPTYDELQRENEFLKSKSYAAREAYDQFYYGKHAQRMADQRHQTFVWQARASEILIWIVVIVCLSGVVFSGYQLWRATSPKPFGGSTVKADGDPLATNVELSWQNVRVTSSVIGLVVLVISVAYLYLFLKEVYQIDMEEELTTDSPVGESPTKIAPPTTSKLQ